MPQKPDSTNEIPVQSPPDEHAYEHDMGGAPAGNTYNPRLPIEKYPVHRRLGRYLVGGIGLALLAGGGGYAAYDQITTRTVAAQPGNTDPTAQPSVPTGEKPSTSPTDIPPSATNNPGETAPGSIDIQKINAAYEKSGMSIDGLESLNPKTLDRLQRLSPDKLVKMSEADLNTVFSIKEEDLDPSNRIQSYAEIVWANHVAAYSATMNPDEVRAYFNDHIRGEYSQYEEGTEQRYAIPAIEASLPVGTEAINPNSLESYEAVAQHASMVARFADDGERLTMSASVPTVVSTGESSVALTATYSITSDLREVAIKQSVDPAFGAPATTTPSFELRNIHTDSTGLLKPASTAGYQP